MQGCFFEESTSCYVDRLTAPNISNEHLEKIEQLEDLVNGFPSPDLASMSSANAKISAIVFAEDMDNSLLLGSSCWMLPSNVFSSVGW